MREGFSGASGTKKNKEVFTLKPKVQVSINIQPFGNFRNEIPGVKHPYDRQKPEKPDYIEPSTTNIEKIEIHYREEDKTYSVPKTTASL